MRNKEQAHFSFSHGIPSQDTFSRVFSRLDPQAFHQCFISWTSMIVEKTQGEVVSVDGKTLRRSYDKPDGKAAIHVVNAWASDTGIVLGQLRMSEKSNEITAIPELLDMLEVSGCIVSIDAMGCQTAIAEKIRDKGADYLLAVKSNQNTLYEDIKLFLDDLLCLRTIPIPGPMWSVWPKNDWKKR
ncbi:ISAs1 family transposase [Oceanospirillum beijerinckii]|uniref:ISAs1 family transposase n=1 Tax=Oceanospirillum beijerinckii TaxID=64976 RepID=UPI000407F415|nr:ISAs1 family transposase [Oceanospirillum beijerinckii]